MTSIRFPGKLEVSTKFFGQFTVKDLLRLLTPSGLVYIFVPSIFGFLLAGALGVTWYWFTPYGQHLDTLLYNLIRYRTHQKKIDMESEPTAFNEIIRMGDDRAAAFVKVTPTNLDMKSEDERKALHSLYRNLLDTVNYPVHVISRQDHLDLEDYIQKLDKPGNTRQDIRHQYMLKCREFSDQDLSYTTHYIKIFAEKNVDTLMPSFLQLTDKEADEKPLTEELNSRCNEVIDAINSAELQAEQVTDSDLKTLSNFYPGTVSENIEPDWTSVGKKFNTKGYRKSLYLSEYPSTVELGWPLQLLRTEGLVDITQVIEPRRSAKASTKLQRLSEKLNAEIDSILSHGYRGTNKLETLLEDTEWILDLLAERRSTAVDYGVYITAKANDKESCIQTYRQIQNRLDTLRNQYTKPVLRTDEAFKTDHPAYGDALNETHLMPSTSAAAGFPFGTQSTQQNQGVIYGVDTSDQAPVLADRFQWSSHSMVRMGMVGSGKSYAAKIELLRSAVVYDNLQIITVDPKQEYRTVTEALGGSIEYLDSTSDYHFPEDQHVCFQVKDRGEEENVRELVELIREIYSYVSQDQRKTLVLIDEARILMNDEEGRKVLNQFVLEGRDTNTAVTLVTQNASHFTYCREGREILDNVPGKVFMRHDRVPDSVVDYFQLSERERQELYELKTGTDSEYSEAILKISGNLDTRIKIESTPAEHDVIHQEEQ
ncbi:ATP-binding protein [Halonotius pteroides]|uniref:Transfer complex-like protein n=1 Tax=Halonotius pteroides TaxID=268735 RepID=A0A3A6QB08_9EURY|nr:ATP-binding protein [Halonotius pteroides]RJX51904.1 transfer complex-like protein [Halonotius pteroides]